MINKLIKKSNLILFQHKSLYRLLDENQKIIYANIDKYLEDYCKFNGFRLDDVIEIHGKFIDKYNDHCRDFIKTKTYPAAHGNLDYHISREHYDIVLILSCLLVSHRFRIIEYLCNSEIMHGRVSFIGVGSGLEIFIIKHKLVDFIAYDTSIGEFQKKLYEHQLLNEKFKTIKDYYNNIIALELLEHLEKPLELIECIYESLSNNGKFITSTAKNIPQFDHLYNFINENEFEDKVKKIGFKIDNKEKINHASFDKRIQSNNILYRFIK